jgi:hypothetical protein
MDMVEKIRREGIDVSLKMFLIKRQVKPIKTL